MRIPTYAVWETVVFALNILAFIFIGLQIRPILDAPGSGGAQGATSRLPAAVLVTVIVVRLAWHMSFNAVDPVATPPRSDFIRRGRCCGRRSAAAWSFPGRACAASSRWRRRWRFPPAFPYRDLILLTAFAVVLGTLVIQG